MSLFAELKQRRVIRAALVYAVVAWVAIQVADTVMPRLGMPDWTVTFVIVLAGLGFPVALVLAWLYDITPQGVQRAGQTGAAPRAAGLIGLGMVIALVVFGAYWRLQPNDAKDGGFENSVAVLPFADMSEKKDQEYFGDGITEEILNGLSQLPGLRVPARTSSFSFKGKNLSVREIAKQLGVAHILEGSVRKSGDRVRITAQLIDARTDQHLWSEVYDRNLNDVFAVQGEIARAIVNALEVRMKTGTAGLIEQETSNGQAHELYLRGLYYWHRRHTDELPLALEYFKQAAREDPKYARAHAGVALAYAVVPQYTPIVPVETAIREGKAAAARALALDSRAADAHAALGQIAQEFEWDWKNAEAHLDAALKLDPNYATAHQWRAELYMVLGRWEPALAEIDRALTLDPLSSVMKNIRALALHRAGRDEESIALLKSVVEQDPGFQGAQRNLLGMLLMAGKYDDFRHIVGNDKGSLAIVAGIEDHSKAPAAMQLLGDARLRADIEYGDLALLYLLLGRQDSAATMLNRGAEHWESQIAYWVHDRLTEPLQGNPQFEQYRRKVRL